MNQEDQEQVNFFQLAIIDEIDIEDFGKIKVSIVDAATPLIYILAEDLGLKGSETPDEFDSNINKMDIIQKSKEDVQY